MNKIKVAVAQYDIGFFSHFNDFTFKLESWFKTAHKQEADVLVFPEYGSMELTSLFGQAIYSDLEKQLHAMQKLYADYTDCYQQLASQYNVHVLASSFPLQLEDRQFYNRASLFTPAGIAGFQDKLIMTRFENEKWIVRPGKALNVIPTELGIFGVNICYDVEFPLFARQQTEMGAQIILVPSCTDGPAGFNRVRLGAQARALENQCYVLQSPTVGRAEWSPSVDCNTGYASIYTPVDHGFPANGILSQALNGDPQWIIAELDLRELTYIRKQGQVLNYRDWPKQFDSVKPKE